MFLRTLVWAGKIAEVGLPDDQKARHSGYRREYVCHQFVDIDGNRVPNPSEHYTPTTIGAVIGPGLATLPEGRSLNDLNALVWSSIIEFPIHTNLIDDLPRIRAKLRDLRKHYNSQNELRDARRHLAAGETKACVRAAAPAVDAALRYYSQLWGVPFPDQPGLTFDVRIETLLANAGQPSFRSVDSASLGQILYLYRARNSMHEGECYYRNSAGVIVEVGVRECDSFVQAVEAFILWADSLA